MWLRAKASIQYKYNAKHSLKKVSSSSFKSASKTINSEAKCQKKVIYLQILFVVYLIAVLDCLITPADTGAFATNL